MNFEYTPEELTLFKELETAVKKESPSPEALLQSLTHIGYTALSTNGCSSALPAAQEKLAQWQPHLFLAIEYSLRVAAPLIQEFAPEWQTTAEEILHGKKLISVAFSPSSQSAPALFAKVTEEEVTLSGFRSEIPHAKSAHAILTLADLENGDSALLLLEPDTPHLSLTPCGTGLYTLEARGVTLPLSHMILLDPKKSPQKRYETLKAALQAAEATGHSAAAFYQAKKAAKVRPEGGKPPIAKQEVGFTLATMYTLLQTSRLMATHAATAKASDAAMTAACARVFCSDAAKEVCTSAISVMGDQSFEAGGPLERLQRVQALGVEMRPTGQTREAIGNLLLKY